MAGYEWISLTTDYGTFDGFVAACHGSIARIAPDVRIIDVTHHVPPADGLTTVTLTVTCQGQKVLGMPKAVVRA